jgi:hypothetical protein
MWRRIWDSITEKPWFAFLFIGVLLPMVAFVDEIPKTGIKIHGSPYQPFLFAAGGVLILAAIFLAIRQEPSLPLQTPSSPSSVRGAPAINPKLYGVAITKPKSDTVNQSPVILVGTIARPLPNNLELWLIGVAGTVRQPKYWPYARVVPDGKKKWTLEYKSGTGLRKLQLYLVGNDGQALMASFVDINRAFISLHGGDHYPLSILTSDMIPACELLTIKIESPNVGSSAHTTA